LEQNEALQAVCIARWTPRGEMSSSYLVAGGSVNLTLSPRTCSQGFLDVYKISNGSLELVHRTHVEGPVTALGWLGGRLLAGIGKVLRLYDLGRRRLLRKCENRHIPNLIIDIQTIGQRVYASDVQESVFCIRYKKRENQLIIFADDTHPRWITNTCILDYDTVASADKFGNVAILRLPASVSDDVDEDPTGNKALWDRGQ
jgi:splicing factor 3B subunit 3